MGHSEPEANTAVTVSTYGSAAKNLITNEILREVYPEAIEILHFVQGDNNHFALFVPLWLIFDSVYL